MRVPRPSNRHRSIGRWRGVAAQRIAVLALLSSGALAACGSTAKPQTTWLVHKDLLAGYSIQYPSNWDRYVPPQGAQFLAGPDSHDYAEVRIISGLSVSFRSGTGDAAAEKAVIDNLLAGQSIDVVQEKQVVYAGLNGWEYDYSFQDQKYGTGLHFHVFLFQGDRMHTIVLQALPASRSKALANDFARILNTYQALPLSEASPAPTLPPASPSSSP